MPVLLLWNMNGFEAVGGKNCGEPACSERRILCARVGKNTRAENFWKAVRPVFAYFQSLFILGLSISFKNGYNVS